MRDGPEERLWREIFWKWRSGTSVWALSDSYGIPVGELFERIKEMVWDLCSPFYTRRYMASPDFVKKVDGRIEKGGEDA